MFRGNADGGNGKIHFEEVRDIFQNVKLMTIICGIVAVVGGVLQIRKKEFKFLRNSSILIILLPLLLATALWAAAKELLKQQASLFPLWAWRTS